MKQNFFDQLDGGWGDLITDTYKEANSLIPKYSTDKEGKIIVTPLSDKTIKEPKELYIKDGTYAIANAAFEDNYSIKGYLHFPDSVEIISDKAFSNCILLNQLSLPKNLKVIGNKTFYMCYNIKSTLELPNQLITIGEGAFYYCSFLYGDLVIPDSVTKIESYSFYKCKYFTSLKLSSNIEFIGQSVFANCINMTGDLIIPESVKEIHYNAFNKCNFERIYIPKHLKEIKTFLGTCRETAEIIIY